MSDVIVEIAETTSDRARDHRPAVREAAQAAYAALFEVPADDPVPGVDRALRHLIAARAAWLDGDSAAADWYIAGTDGSPETLDVVVNGPDGRAGRAAPRAVRAALRHVDLLVTRPAAATAEDLSGLIAAGWTPAEVVVIGQIVGLVSYQVRVAHALRVQEELFAEGADA